MYQITSRHKSKQRRRSRFWLAFMLLFLIIGLAMIKPVMAALHQKPVVTQAKAVITKVSYAGKTKHYDEGDFTIDIPIEWQMSPRPPYTYQSFTWHNTDKADGQTIEIYEDTIPAGIAVNKVLILTGATNHVEMAGPASDSCVKFTEDQGAEHNEQGVPAKWQNVPFLCDRLNTARDLIGTSSADGINTVTLKASDDTLHKFFFTYTDSMLSPDYTAFYNAVVSFNMK